MPEIGQTISHYKIVEKIGQGGMGEVYKADDTTLDRKVALKFLPEAFTSDPERMARFEREAKLLASLNHPNIAGIYGLEQADGGRFLVLEYVEGETLQARLGKGALPLEDALELCRQIAEGLEAAHEKGVIHRDLKPTNVMITADEKVKILDFGLAKALLDETQSIDSSQSPTLTEAMTRPGVILGTAAYMSPEQAKGKSVDKRADIWAFGCILYECLAGKKAFGGETVTETLASVIKEEPEFELVSASARLLVQKCLAKDRKHRLRDIGDAMTLLIVHEPETVEPESLNIKRPWLAWSVAALFLITTLVVSIVHFHETPNVSPEPARFQIPLPENTSLSFSGLFALSPDGRRLVFDAVGADGVRRLWVRSMDSLEARPLVGTEYTSNSSPFWSPDSRYIAFHASGSIKKLDVLDGSIQTLCSWPGFIVGGSWNKEDVIIFGTITGGLMRLSASGGTASELTSIDSTRMETYHALPCFLPDGRHFLYERLSEETDKSAVYIGSLDAKPEEQESRTLIKTKFGASFVPGTGSSAGYLLFMRERTLMAQPFDDNWLAPGGDAVPVAENISVIYIEPRFSVSATGILIYQTGFGSQNRQMIWYDSKGNVLRRTGKAGYYTSVSLSPDDSRAVITQTDSQGTNLWLFDFVHENLVPFTFGQGESIAPVWSWDGSQIIFRWSRAGTTYLYRKLASGAKDAKALTLGENKFPTSWSSDGRYLLYYAQDPKTKTDLWVLPLEGDRKPEPILNAVHDESIGKFSPDGRWIAYMSNESGNYEVYVRPFIPNASEDFPAVGTQRMISRGGGYDPRWRYDGKELYYLTPNGAVAAVEITVSPDFHSGEPESLFQAPPSSLRGIGSWDVSRDGKRFLFVVMTDQGTSPPFNVVLNWQAGLKK
jgi:serine/threonine protein kinase